MLYLTWLTGDNSIEDRHVANGDAVQVHDDAESNNRSHANGKQDVERQPSKSKTNRTWHCINKPFRISVSSLGAIVNDINMSLTMGWCQYSQEGPQ